MWFRYFISILIKDRSYTERQGIQRGYTCLSKIVYVWVRASNSPRYWYKQGAGPSWSVLCNQGSINIEGGQSVRERSPDRRSVRAGHLRLFARSCHAFCSYPSYPTRDITRWRHPPVGRAPVVPLYETSNYAKTRSDTNDGYTQPDHANHDDSSVCIRPTGIFLCHPITTNARSPINSPPSQRCLSDREISASSFYYLGYFKGTSIISYLDIVKKKDTSKYTRAILIARLFS